MNELFAALEPTPNSAEPALWPESVAAPVAATPAYRVLARKYRPSTFGELIGQEAMVRTLTNAIAAGRLPQAWMLTGVRGIGKTTTARIIARALNCTGADGKGGATITPCGVCDNCKAIAEDRHVDVQEMDAASRTSVDDIRDIIDGVRYGPVAARYKIYILDEVHMLSKNAFNALLKTLEEPPPHTKFIFATTEIRKVPVTVLSRCQRFDLRRIDSQMLAEHFRGVAAKESVTIDDAALHLLARAADGSVRDGLSLLDQAIARGDGTVSAADVQDMLGLADRAHSQQLCGQLLRGDMPAALATFAASQATGADPVQILQDLAELIHLLTKAQAIPNYAAQPDLAEAERVLLRDLAAIKVPALTRSWQILLKGITEVQAAANPSQATEMVLIRLGYAANLPPPGELIRRIQDSAAGMQGQAGSPTASPSPNAPKAMRAALGSGESVRLTQPEPILDPNPKSQIQNPATFRALVALFETNREGALHAMLYSQVHLVRMEAGILELGVGENLPANFAARVMQCLSAWTGQRWMVSLQNNKGGTTLADEDRAKELRRQERAAAHPLMQAAMAAFPEAKLISLTRKTVAPEAAAPDSDAETATHTHPIPEDET